jgi:hypothetical protein
MRRTLNRTPGEHSAQQFESFFGQLQLMVALQVAPDDSQMTELVQIIRNLRSGFATGRLAYTASSFPDRLCGVLRETGVRTRLTRRREKAALVYRTLFPQPPNCAYSQIELLSNRGHWKPPLLQSIPKHPGKAKHGVISSSEACRRQNLTPSEFPATDYAPRATGAAWIQLISENPRRERSPKLKRPISLRRAPQVTCQMERSRFTADFSAGRL